MFSHAIVRTPGKSMVNGLTAANLGNPNYELALVQHQNYVNVLKECDLDVTVMSADEDYPDSTFVEDTALMTPHCAIITNPGHPSRKGEVKKITETVNQFYDLVEHVGESGMIDAGDIMMVGTHYYIGLSERTNIDGAQCLIKVLKKYGMQCSTVRVHHVLHLKAGAAYLENNNLVVSGEFIEKPEFDSFNRIVVPDEEAYAANCVWINGTVLVASGHPVTSQKIEDAGYLVKEVEMSEFQKLDGGLSCLSLRF